jgi:hypothetical protein
MTYHIDSDRADTIRERFGEPVQQGFSERFMRPQPCGMPETGRGEIFEPIVDSVDKPTKTY